MSGNVFVADNSAIRFINKASGIVTTIAGVLGFSGSSGDGLEATSAKLNYPNGLSLDTINNLLYIADTSNNKIRLVRLVTLSSGNITTYAGTGLQGSSGDDFAATGAQLNEPQGVSIDLYGNVYIADANNLKIRRVNSAGIISTFAGTGIYGSSGDGFAATLATMTYPQGVACDRNGNVYFSDIYNHKIRMVNNVGIITTIAGSTVYGYGLIVDGTAATSAFFGYSPGVTVDNSGNIYIVDSNSYVVYRVNNSTGLMSTAAGVGAYGSAGDGGAATGAHLVYPRSLAVDVSGSLYIADATRVREVYAIFTSHAPTSKPTVWNPNVVRDIVCACIALYFHGSLYEPSNCMINQYLFFYLFSTTHHIRILSKPLLAREI